jgi:hypothetical protein
MRLADPGLDGITIRNDIGRRLDGIATEQLSGPVKQCPYFVQLLLQPRISHALTLPTPGLVAQFTDAIPHCKAEETAKLAIRE